MRTTIDSAGRLVVPKRLREELGVAGGDELEIGIVDGRLEIEPAPTPKRIEQREAGPVIVAEGEPLPKLTAEQVRETLERVRP